MTFLGMGSESPPTSYGSEERCNLLSGVRGEVPVKIDLGTVSTLKAIFVKNDSLEPLVMLVNFFLKFSGCSNTKTPPSYGLA